MPKYLFGLSQRAASWFGTVLFRVGAWPAPLAHCRANPFLNLRSTESGELPAATSGAVSVPPE